MISVDTIHQHLQDGVLLECQNGEPLDIFDSAECQALATQAIADRHLTIDPAKLTNAWEPGTALPVRLIEDDYPGWLRDEDLKSLEQTKTAYRAIEMDREAIAPLLDQVVAFAKDAMAVPNEYLWGGTLGPNLDCSGLVQRAYGSQGIWLPRDAYQQEAFSQDLALTFAGIETLDSILELGDLIFFGSPEKATHVAIYLGDGQYIHSSGKEQGRNGIGIDSLTDLGHPVSQTYFSQYRGAGRVLRSFCP